jgi:hypothetical protein
MKNFLFLSRLAFNQIIVPEIPSRKSETKKKKCWNFCRKKNHQRFPISIWLMCNIIRFNGDWMRDEQKTNDQATFWFIDIMLQFFTKYVYLWECFRWFVKNLFPLIKMSIKFVNCSRLNRFAPSIQRGLKWLKMDFG